MPMYRFTLVDCGQVIGTQDQELPDDQAAMDEAYGHDPASRQAAVNPLDPLAAAGAGLPARWVEPAKLDVATGHTHTLHGDGS